MANMISREEVDRLAELSRLDLREEERERFGAEIGQILEYIDEIKAVDVSEAEHESVNVNTMREDSVENEPGQFSDEIVRGMPESEDGHLKIHKILGGDE